MNNYLILDCSCFISLILPDEKKYNYDLAKYDIIVPSIFYLECLNTIHTALKRKRIAFIQLQEYEGALKHFPCDVDQFSSNPESIASIARLCKEYDNRSGSNGWSYIGSKC